MVSSKRKFYRLDSGSVFALKAASRKGYRTDAAALACHPSKDDPEVTSDLANRHLFAKDRERNTLVYLEWNPFVAGLIQVFEDAHMLYIAMEFIPGGTLRSLLRRTTGGLCPRDVNFYFGNIVCALEFLHQFGIIHRDLKPENILVNADGYLCLTDFGEATYFKYQDPKSKEVGTSFYMAPECQFTSVNDPSDHPMAVDWWSSGCILYEMITGKLAFFGKTSVATQFKSAEGMAAVQWPPSIKAGKNLKALVSSLLELDPELRLGQETEHVKCDPWLSNIDWSKMQRRKYLAPFMPKLIDSSELWHDSPLPKQEYIPGLKTVEPPLHLAHDDRYPERRERAL
ncbi:hypothetical protein GALMADRAFT_207144 [Galerina marginata CBS 339.88]|uniref:non-specific serine/threonine protein kinase n=1 Tax=Galerina marginata (strain CBS 339.88) TaxID=685588 RepID=A0A067TP68_GALM3|nr:hypothetical protein GALMADRAFT_207144 [Galerina marginata CBS 339.88]